ncbi:MAG: D-sedoheptulose 7-phosphate isomerase [Saprospiraceae bacterium]|nr:D-sedoheptulose 7-phosphate isomerase [Saprospiraceae bacterium]MBP7680033.1 D-sedoheptulose 7-phosphate isomerase [Saprospiraceae bacterium]
MLDTLQIQQIIQNSISVKQQILEQETLLTAIKRAADVLTLAFKADKKVLFCGNGGSAGDAQHIAAELSGRFYKDREPLYAEALHVNSSYMTAVANDYSFDEVYARMVRAAGRTGDVLVAISTSGNSPNIVRALQQARNIGMITIGMTGVSGGKMKPLCDVLLNVPSGETPRIQESHILIGHILCEIIEQRLFS